MENHIIETKIHGKDVTIGVSYGWFLSENLFEKFFWKQVEELNLGTTNFIELKEINKHHLAKLSLKVIGEVMSLVLEDNPEYITFSPFLINVIVRRLSIGASYDKRSTEAIAGIRVSYTLPLMVLPSELKKIKDGTPYNIRESLLYRGLSHEFVHHLDREFIIEGISTAQILSNRVGNNIYNFMLKARVEGVPRYKEFLYSQELPLNFEVLKIFKEYLKVLLSKEVTASFGKVMLFLFASGYELGPIMCYTIGLSKMKETYSSQEERAIINKLGQNLVTYAKNGEPVQVKNLPQVINSQVIKSALATDVDEFLRQYEIALKKLRIPEEFGVMTFRSFKKSMVRCYLNYVNITIPMIKNLPLYKRFLRKLMSAVAKPLAKYIGDKI